jgi:hypothetical protein
MTSDAKLPAEETFARNHVVLKKIERTHMLGPVSLHEGVKTTIPKIILRWKYVPGRMGLGCERFID